MPTKKLYPYNFIYKPNLISEEIVAVGVGNLLDELERIYVSAITNAKAIKTNGELTVKGQQAKIKELLVDTDRQIKDFQSSHIGYTETAKQLLDSMQPKRDAPDVISEMRQAEIRGYLQRLDPLDAEVEYRAATERGDYLFLDAVERAPIPFKFATQALIDKISFARLEKANPVEATKLRDVRTAQETVDSALKSVRVSLAKDGLDLSEDLVGQEAA